VVRGPAQALTLGLRDVFVVLLRAKAGHVRQMQTSYVAVKRKLLEKQQPDVKNDEKKT
jgi:hypothetical protein